MSITTKLLASAFALLTLGQATTAATAAERNFVLGSFDRIVVEGDIAVNIETGKSPSASASGTRKVLDRVRLERNGRTLTVRLNGASRTGGGDDARADPVEVRLSTNRLEELTMRGNGSLSVGGIKGDLGKILLLGAGQIDIGTVELDKLFVTINGNGQVKMASGKTRNARVQLNGAGNWSANGVVADRLDLIHAGPATSAVTVKESADISSSGAGSITIGGDPDCDIRSTGSARIVCGTKKGARGEPVS